MNVETEEEQYGFRRGKGTKVVVIGLFRTIGERYIEKGIEVYVALVDLENTFVRDEQYWTWRE